MKQTTSNPFTTSRRRGWHLFKMMAATIPPSKIIWPIVQEHVLIHAGSTRDPAVRKASKAVLRSLKVRLFIIKIFQSIFSQYSVYVQCEGFAQLTFFLCVLRSLKARMGEDDVDGGVDDDNAGEHQWLEQTRAAARRKGTHTNTSGGVGGANGKGGPRKYCPTPAELAALAHCRG